MSGTDHYYNTIPITPINPRKCLRIGGGDLEIGRLTSEQKSEFTGTRHGVTDRERDDATTGTSRITMTKNKIKY